jgi:archaemetzincin
VVSLARLEQGFYGLPRDTGLTARRAIAEVLHEVGHLAGLAHCDRYDCLMHFCPDVESIDLRGLSFCAECSVALPEEFLRTASARR